MGLGPVHRTAFRRYQADLQQQLEADPEVAAEAQERRRQREEFLRTAEARRREEQDRRTALVVLYVLYTRSVISY